MRLYGKCIVDIRITGIKVLVLVLIFQQFFSSRNCRWLRVCVLFEFDLELTPTLCPLCVSSGWMMSSLIRNKWHGIKSHLTTGVSPFGFILYPFLFQYLSLSLSFLIISLILFCFCLSLSLFLPLSLRFYFIYVLCSNNFYRSWFIKKNIPAIHKRKNLHIKIINFSQTPKNIVKRY